MKKLELNQMENSNGGSCTQKEKMDLGVSMLVLGALSFGTLSILVGLGGVMYCAA